MASKRKREQHLSPAEAARQLGVTVKTLRVYETRGLLEPLRTANGWRAYGIDQIARVHEILALKSLGLTLAQIGELLRGRAADLSLSLATHRVALEAQREAIHRALALVETAQARIAAGETPSASDLVALARSAGKPDRTWSDHLKRAYERHLKPEDWSKLDPGSPALWAELIAELKRLLAANAEPASSEAQAFWRRWRAAGEAATGGDAGVGARAYAAWKGALADPEMAAQATIGVVETEYLARLAEAAILGKSALDACKKG